MKRRYKILNWALAFMTMTLFALALYVSHNSACSPSPALPAGVQSMQASVYRCYGSPEVLKLETIAKPTLTDDAVLVKVQAASVNPLDWHYLRGEPYIMRMEAGVGAPADVRLGTDFSGIVEAVGKNVTRFKPGDRVFGGADGAFAEYVSVRESRALTLMSANLTFEQAATVPIAGITALQALRDEGALKPGQKVLINGASGGVGTFAVQIAKALGAEVTGVCSTRNLALVQQIGADHVVDYTQQDFTQGSQTYDLIIDTVGNHSSSALRRALKATGVVVIVGGPKGGRWLGSLAGALKAVLYSKFVSQKFEFFLAHLNKEDLAILADLIRDGKLTPVIDRRFSLSNAPAALAYVEEGHARGKVIINVAQ